MLMLMIMLILMLMLMIMLMLKLMLMLILILMLMLTLMLMIINFFFPKVPKNKVQNYTFMSWKRTKTTVKSKVQANMINEKTSNGRFAAITIQTFFI